jgi:hypothetical protein
MNQDGKNVVMKAAESVASGKPVEKSAPNAGKSKRKKVKLPFDRALEKARAIFKTQLDRGAETKKLAISTGIARQGVDYTEEQFLSEYVRRIGRLLDSKKFNKDCQAVKLDPFSVSTHIAFDGLRQTYNVLDNGLVSEYKDYFSEMKDPVYTAKDLKKFDTEDLIPETSPE